MCKHLLRPLLLLVLTPIAFAQLGQMGGRQTGQSQIGQSAPMSHVPEPPNVVDTLTKKRVLVSNYCRLDYEGTRLRPDGWNRFKAYTSILVNPKYNGFFIVTRFNVEPPAPSGVDDLYYVNYPTVAYYDDRLGYRASTINERTEIQVEDVDGELRVTHISPEMPHVSPRAAMEWINLRLADPKTSDDARIRLKDAAEHLSKYLPQPKPATPTPDK